MGLINSGTRALVPKTDHAKLFQTITCMSAWLITSAGFDPLCPQTYHVQHIVSANPCSPGQFCTGNILIEVTEQNGVKHYFVLMLKCDVLFVLHFCFLMHNEIKHKHKMFFFNIHNFVRSFSESIRLNNYVFCLDYYFLLHSSFPSRAFKLND